MSAIDRNLLTGINELGKPEFVSVTNGSILISTVEGTSSSGSLSGLQTSEITYVKVADVNGATYKTSDCIGQIKSIKQYNSTSTSGDYAVLTTFEYSDSDFPKKRTKIIDSVTTV